MICRSRTYVFPDLADEEAAALERIVRDTLPKDRKVVFSLDRVLACVEQDPNWEDVRKNTPGKQSKTVPTVFASTEAAELIVTAGEPKYSPIPPTRLMQVSNTESVLFLHPGEKQYYYLAAGRWFRAKSLDGPWTGGGMGDRSRTGRGRQRRQHQAWSVRYPSVACGLDCRSRRPGSDVCRSGNRGGRAFRGRPGQEAGEPRPN
jgi:hypothetical protein